MRGILSLAIVALALLYSAPSSADLTAHRNAVWNQGARGVTGDGEAGDRYGSALVTGDFNGDGYDDFAAGVPGEDVDGVQNAGAVSVFYGSAVGITLSNNQYFAQGSRGELGDLPETDDSIGSALAVGDFDSDGFDDLAIGVPSESELGMEDSGIVHIIYGSQGGLNPNRVQFVGQTSLSIVLHEAGDQFGAALATGDFDRDGFDDLAIGVPLEDVGNVVDAGGVVVVFGAAGGLNTARSMAITQNMGSDSVETGDRFGEVLSAGDYNNDGFDDLVVSAPSEDLGAVPNAGSVEAFFGSSTGLTGNGHQFFTRADRFSENAPIGFGNALATGDWNGDGIVDFYIGIQRNTFGSQSQAGAVLSMLGSPAGITTSVGFVNGVANAFYGSALALGDFNGNGLDEVAIGAFGLNNEAGAVIVRYLGGPFAVEQTWDQDSPGIVGTREPGDGFGLALASGDFDNDGYADLLIGAPGEDLGSRNDAGTVNLLYGASVFIFRSGFETGGN